MSKYEKYFSLRNNLVFIAGVFLGLSLVHAQEASTTPETTTVATTTATTTVSQEPVATATATSTVQLSTASTSQSTSTSSSSTSVASSSTSTASTTQTQEVVTVTPVTQTQDQQTNTNNIIDDAINAVKKIFDQSPPDRIADLHVISASSKRVSVGWTVPFDDSGKIAGYEARLSRTPFSESNWSNAISFGGTPGEAKTGDRQVMDFSDLPENAELYIAIKAVDPAGKMSAISDVIVTKTTSGGSSSSARSFSSQAQNINDALNLAAKNVANNPNLEYGTVMATIVTPDGLPSPFPIFVNFINTSTGLSYGGPTVNGLASYRIPTGDYYMRLVVTDTQFKEPTNPPTFTIGANEDKNLGTVTLSAKDLGEKTDALLTEASKQGGVAKMLVTIIRLLSEVLDTLQKIAFKLNVEN